MHSMMRKAGVVMWCAGLLAAIFLMARIVAPYSGFDRHFDFLATKQKVYHINYWRISFYVHVFTSIAVLPAGFTQFNPVFYKSSWHRNLGKIYLFTVLLLSAPTGFLMAIHANGGLAAKASFVLLTLLWFSTTLMAFIRVRQRRFEVHGEWMLYSYSLALSAITFRLYAWLFDVLHVDARPQEVYVTIAWLSWVPNLLIAEAMIRSGFARRMFRRFSEGSDRLAANDLSVGVDR
jgi:hypothetical protein